MCQPGYTLHIYSFSDKYIETNKEFGGISFLLLLPIYLYLPVEMNRSSLSGYDLSTLNDPHKRLAVSPVSNHCAKLS